MNAVDVREIRSVLDELGRRIYVAAEETAPYAGSLRRLFLTYALAAHLKGREVTVRDIHDAWATWVEMEELAESVTLLPWDDLSPELQMLDYPDYEAVKRIVGEEDRASV